MSMELMVKAMKLKVGNPLRKLVLLKLADNASDQGECWPSYQHIADQCEISRRSVIAHIKVLEESGFLKINIRKATNSSKLNASNLFFLTLDKGSESPAPGGGEPPAPGSESPALGSESPALGGGESPAPRTSHSFEPVKEPIIKRKRTSTKKSALEFSELAISEAAAKQFVDYRKKLRKPLTQRALHLAACEIRKAGDHLGISDEDLVAEVELAGWLGVKAEWLINRLSNPGGPRNDLPQPANPFGDDSDWLDDATRQRVIQATGGHQAGLEGCISRPDSDCSGQEPVAYGAGRGGHIGLERD